LYKVGTNYVLAYAPWVSPKQWIKAKTSTTLSNILSAGTEVDITGASYDANVWIDMWPTGFTSIFGDTYLFYTSERNPNDPTSEIDGNIWYLPVEWTVTNDHYTYIKNAVGAAASGDIIDVDTGIYTESGQIEINKDLSIQGSGKDQTIIKTHTDTGSSGDSRGWFLVTDGTEFNLKDLTLDGEGHLIWQGIRHKGTGTIENVKLTNIKYQEGGPSYSGVAITAFGSGTANVHVYDSEFSEIGRVGVLYFGTGITGSEFKNNVYTGKGTGDWLDYALDISAGAKVWVQNNEISQCKGVASSDGSASAGIMVTTYYGGGTESQVLDNNVHDNSVGLIVGYDGSDTSTVVAQYNNFVNNDDFGVESTASNVDSTYNWWGDVSGPAGEGPGTGDAVSTNVDYEPWLGAGVSTGSLGPERLFLVVGTPETSGDGSVTIEAFGSGTATVYLITYTDRPWDESPVFSGDSNFFDVRFEPGANPDPGITELEITFHNPGGRTIYWWDKDTEEWAPCSDQVLNPDGSITVTVTSETTPNLDDLLDPPFGGGDPVQVPVLSPVLLAVLFVFIGGFGYYFIGRK